MYQDGQAPKADVLAAYDPQLALVPPALHAEAVASTAKPSVAEHHALRNIVVATLAATLLVQTLDWAAEAKTWEQKGRFDGPSFDRRMSKVFRQRLGPSLAPVFSGLLLMGRGTVGDALSLAYSSDQARPVADRWARSYGNKVAADYAASSAEAIGNQVADWINAGVPAASMAQRARRAYGLDPRAAHAIASYTAGKGKDRSTLIERYLEHRADTNASVWSMSAQNAGREMLFVELVEAGLLPKTTRKVWLTAHDERVCPVCGPMDKISVPLLTRFHVGGAHLTTPPVHPECRCTITVDTQPRAGFVFPKDFDMMHGWLRSATRTVFR
jgi:hypothetical protein